jgi:hypothetical protein
VKSESKIYNASANQNESNTAGTSELQKATEVVEHMNAS